MAGLIPLYGLGGFGAYQGPTLLSSAPVPAAVRPWQWYYVESRFTRLLDNLAITDAQLQDGTTKQAGVRACLNRAYWGHSSETANSLLIGSWGKLTQVRPSRDIDILFLLPPSVYHQYQGRSGNRQSQLLQEVKNALAETYSQTTMRGDGQVVVIPFNTIPIEVSPGFRCTDGSILVCDANNQGRYITSTAEPEAADLAAADAAFNYNARPLVRMMKLWQRERNVPLKSFQLERLAIEFLRVWPHSMRGRFWYDWMVRDFLAYLTQRANGYLTMPGSGEIVPLGSDWLSRVQTAHSYAVRACDHEYANNNAPAGQAWQEIFGNAIPMIIP